MSKIIHLRVYVPVILAVSLLMMGIVSAQTLNWQTLLKQTVPEADKFSQIASLDGYKSKNLTQAAFPAYKGSTQIGVVFYAAPKGYQSLLHTLTVMDMNGTILKVNIFNQNETPSYVENLYNGSYQRQFEGITLSDKMVFLIGTRPAKRGEIMAMTGSTDTSKPIAIAVSEARKLFAEMYNK